jgi:hypothetical protein
MKLSGRYMRLSDEDKKKVDDELKNTYNFPRPSEIPREVKQESASTVSGNNSGNQTGNENLQDNMSGQFGAYKRTAPELNLNTSTNARTNIKKNNKSNEKKKDDGLQITANNPLSQVELVTRLFSKIPVRFANNRRYRRDTNQLAEDN